MTGDGSLRAQVQAAFTAGGLLARGLPGFAPRSAQQTMAEAVAEALEGHENLVVEAGTGTGKTYAYLLPALLAGRTTVISTGTRHLQDRLHARDLPRLQAALGLRRRTALLKGRGNYLCLYRLDLALSQGRGHDREQRHHLELLRAWQGRTDTGDIAEVEGVPEASPLWPWVTSTAENCLGAECPRLAECFVARARRAAMEAEIVVINHHLLAADLALKEEGFGSLLPEAETLIVDEAHQLPDTLARFFGRSLTSRQLAQLVRDTRQEHLQAGGSPAELDPLAGALERAMAEVRIALGHAGQRLPWSPALERSVGPALARLGDTLEALVDWLETAGPRSRGLAQCRQRALGLHACLQDVQGGEDGDQVRWLEVHARGFGIHFTHLEVATLYQECTASLKAHWIFTSATLAVGRSFDHFLRRLGLEDARTLQLPSPFDYARNALLYLPPDLPDPNAPGYNAAVIETAREVVAASDGRAFLLFTSHRAMGEAAEALRGTLEYPVLVQGEAPRARLLARFRALGNAVLLGTSSFWEGVDVPGEALSLVLIDRLPFAAPGDPVLAARIARLRAQGGNPFLEYQVPQAVIALKQGAGRLIRSTRDRGVLVLCDPRVHTRPYGRLFLESLPPMPVTRSLAEVAGFFADQGAPRDATAGH
ncbi:MAG: ATP-dependent DNA helicase [Gammaproteobacteria bacterium]|nr:MAG: ATP-dependent DNA helicase [Gammaproteobacteria bacterium]